MGSVWTFVGEADCGGEGPLRIVIHGDLLYVLNITNIAGFRILRDGTLRAVPSSARFLATVGRERPRRLRDRF